MIPFHELGKKAHEVNQANGWEVFTPDDWGNNVSVLKLCAHMALIHTEITEAEEAVETNDRDNLREEIADIAIRAASISHGLGVDLEYNVGFHAKRLEIPDCELDIPKGLRAIHKATSHATEAIRKQDAGGLLVQLVTILLHTAALSHTVGSDLSAEMEKKIAKNATRGERHGGKAI